VFTIPYSSLEYGTEYAVNIYGFKDVAGNEMTADTTNRFTTKPIYKVTFVDWDGIVQLKTESVEHSLSATAPADPQRTGYTFTGWDRDFTYITEDMTVTALYSINSYTVTFADWDGRVLKTESVEFGSDAAPPVEPAREGYTFTGWDEDFTVITEDLTITAFYDIDTYKVRFVDWDRKMLKKETVDYDSDATAPADPVREGYTFIGWNTEYANITSHLIVTAQYIINVYDENRLHLYRLECRI
jgi:uncharacterized repeat protein (TIGR02543 family)